MYTYEDVEMLVVIVIVIISFYLGVIIGWECANKAPKVKNTSGFWRDHGE